MNVRQFFNPILGLVTVITLSMITFTSCAKPSFDEDKNTNTEKEYIVKSQIFINDPWTGETRAIGSTDPLFMCYLFGDDGIAIYNRGNVISDNMNVTFHDISKPGSYSIYCITGWFINEYLHTTDDNGENTGEVTLQSVLSMHSPKDICLGLNTFNVNNGQLSYDINIKVEHIMAKAAFKITNVPAEIDEISVTLPNQANQFKFDGTIIGNTQEQTLTLTKNEASNEDGSFDWFVDETIVYPYATKDANMPIHVNMISENATYTFKTTSSKSCSKGKRVSYKADWVSMKFSNNTHVEITPWTETVEESEFELGNAQ